MAAVRMALVFLSILPPAPAEPPMATVSPALLLASVPPDLTPAQQRDRDVRPRQVSRAHCRYCHAELHLS